MIGTIKNQQRESVDSLNHMLQALRFYGESSHFALASSFYSDSPFSRPSRPQDISESLLTDSLSAAELSSNDYLLAQRLLLNIYEQDMVFLPQAPNKLDLQAFKSFYDPELMACGKLIRPALEHFVFDWLEKEVDISGPWCLESFLTHTQQVLDDLAKGDSSLYRELTSSQNPQQAARYFLVQCAGDFLSEASAMARNVLGNFGSHTSELFKILIDEYGYGVDAKKHSTIFEEMLKQAGLSHHIHHYWQFYTASSIALINYFHYVSANHGSLFRYIGAMYFTEATLAFSTRHQSRAIKDIFAGSVSSLYFDEHNHIDVHHGRMALHKLIIPLVKQYGDAIIPDLLRGFEEFRLLQDKADAELYSHIHWHDRLAECQAQAAALRPLRTPDMFFKELRGELSVTHAHPVDELFWVEEGQLEFVAGPEQKIVLNAGEGIVIPKGMLHGTVVLSDSCDYSVTALGDRA